MNRYGFAVSMGDVATEAGVSRGSVYRYFGDRDALVEAVVARAGDRFLGTVAAEVDRRRTLAGQVAAAIAVVVDEAGAPPNATSTPAGSGSTAARAGATLGVAPALGRRSTPRDLVVRPDSRAMAERWLAFWAPRVDAARARGELRADVDGRAAAECLTRLLLSFLVVPRLDVDPADPRAVRRFVDRHLLHGLAA